jgi:ABC-type Fe3+-hydroxamate transport system substrate-binding protein
LVFLGRRRRFWLFLFVLSLCLALALVGCGGASSGSSSSSTLSPGSYQATITAAYGSVTKTSTVSLTVN